jgi:AcrR family transcriptional regulator
MAQVLKPEVRARIEAAALRCFAERGYPGTSMAAIAAEAGTTPGNLYRYVADKEALFAAVVPPGLAARHDELLDTRVAALATGPGARSSAAAEELLQFWLDQRLAVVVLLDRAEGTPLAGYPERFVQRLVKHAERSLGELRSAVSRRVLEVVFDNTRRALASLLRTAADRDEARALVETFWTYQVPGLEALLAHVRANDTAGTGDEEPTAVERPRRHR